MTQVEKIMQQGSIDALKASIKKLFYDIQRSANSVSYSGGTYINVQKLMIDINKHMTEISELLTALQQLDDRHK